MADHGYQGQRETVKTCEELHFDSILVWKENELLFKGKCINSILCNSTFKVFWKGLKLHSCYIGSDSVSFSGYKWV